MTDEDPVVRLTSVYEAQISTMRFYFQLFTTLVVGVAAVLAVIGYNNLADVKKTAGQALKDQVPSAVAAQLNSDKALARQLTEQVMAAEKLQENLNTARNEFIQWKNKQEAQQRVFEEEFKDQLELYRKALNLSGSDISNSVNLIIKQGSESEVFDDPSWVESATIQLYALGNSYRKDDKNNIDANTYFNASTIAAKLNNSRLAFDLGGIAAELDGSDAHTARFSRQAVELGLEVDKNRKKLNGIVTRLSLRSPEIVLAEAWNVAEQTRSYRAFINAIDTALAKEGSEIQYVPSYAHVIKAEALMREGLPGNISQARTELENAALKIDLEGGHTSWYQQTINGSEKLVRIIKSSILVGDALQNMLGNVSQQ